MLLSFHVFRRQYSKTSLGSIFQESLKKLQHANIENPFRETELILSHTLKLSREELSIKNKEEDIDKELVSEVRRNIERRSQDVPFSYITHEKAFWKSTFFVNEHTLIPRPDSETIIEVAEKLFSKDSKLQILDIGTGSGCLLLSILLEFPNAKGLGIDISPEALKVAQQNAIKLKLDQRTKFINNNWLENLKGQYDLIVSNPPYISEDEYQSLDKTVKKYEPKLALVNGIDGLDSYRVLAKTVPPFLVQNGYLLLEIGSKQASDVLKIFQNVLSFVKVEKDLGDKERCLLFQKKKL